MTAVATISQVSAGPTAALLWAACRPEPDLDACEEARDDGADLSWAADVAIEQRVSPLLWRVVQGWGQGATWSNSLRSDSKRCLGQARLLQPRVGEILLGPMAAAGVTPLVWKGASVAPRYPDPALRPMDDIDLVLPAAQHPLALQVLRDHGWRRIDQDGAHYDVRLRHPALPGLPVELHEGLANADEQSFRLSASDLWESRRPMTIAGAPAFGLSPEMEVVALVTHAAKPFHTFERLIWMVDLAVVMHSASESGEAVDWRIVGCLADGARARTALAIALTQAERLGVDSPNQLRQIDCSVARREALAPLCLADWPLRSSKGSARYRLTYALIDDRRLAVHRAIAEIVSVGPRSAPRRAAAFALRSGRRWIASQIAERRRR